MPTDHPSFRVEFTRPDGSILRARVTQRPEGTWAIDLRKLGRGRPTLKELGSLAGVTDIQRARVLAMIEMQRLHNGGAVGTAAAALGPISQVNDYIATQIRIGEMTSDTGAAAATCLLRIWSYCSSVHHFTQWRQIEREHVAPLVKWLMTTEFKGKTLGRNTVIKYGNYAKGFFKVGKDNGIVTDQPLHKHSAWPKKDKSYRREWLEPHEMGLLIDTAFAGRDGFPHNACHAWPEILSSECYTGMREDEVLGLAVEDYTPTGGRHGAGTIHVRNNKWRRLKGEEKAERVVHLWPEYGRIMRAYMKRVNPDAKGLLFPNRKGGMFAELGESMRRDLCRAGIEKKITDHSMRHSYVSARARMYTEVVRAGRVVLIPVHRVDISAEVGHTHENITRDVYEHASEHPVEGWTELNYRTAQREREKELRRAAGGKRASSRAKRSASRR